MEKTKQGVKWRNFIYLLFSILLALETVWIFVQKNNIQELHEGTYSITVGMAQEVINKIEHYETTQDPIALGELFVYVRYLGLETHRIVAYRADPNHYSPSTPLTAYGVIDMMHRTQVPPDKIQHHLALLKQHLVDYIERCAPSTEVDLNQQNLLLLSEHLIQWAVHTHDELDLP